MPQLNSVAQQFPTLFREATWGPLTCRFQLGDSPSPADLIGNVNLVPFLGDRWLLIRLCKGAWDVPGGTLEPGESYPQAMRRELLEEAGARLVSFTPMGAWRCHSSAAGPYRPHMPHPDLYRLVCYGEVEIVGGPLATNGAEQVVDVACVSIEGAYHRFLTAGRPELAELYRLAAAIRKEGLD